MAGAKPNPIAQNTAFEHHMAGAKPLTPCIHTHIRTSIITCLGYIHIYSDIDFQLLTASIAHLHFAFARSTSSWRPRT